MAKRIGVLLAILSLLAMFGCARDPYSGRYQADPDKIATMLGTAAITFGVGAALYGISRAYD